MANVQQTAAGSSNGQGAQWQDLDPARSKLFVKAAEGLVIEGELLGRFARWDGQGAYYQIKLSAPAQVKEEKKDTTAKIGDVVNMDEKSRLSGLASLCGKDDRYRVRITFVKQEPTKKGGKVWITTNQYAHIGKHPAGVTTPDHGPALGMSADKVPF